jgi:hypothetical protein
MIGCSNSYKETWKRKNAPGAIRTHNLGFRRALLYPFELLGLEAIILYATIREYEMGSRKTVN